MIYYWIIFRATKNHYCVYFFKYPLGRELGKRPALSVYKYSVCVRFPGDWPKGGKGFTWKYFHTISPKACLHGETTVKLYRQCTSLNLLPSQNQWTVKCNLLYISEVSYFKGGGGSTALSRILYKQRFYGIYIYIYLSRISLFGVLLVIIKIAFLWRNFSTSQSI